MGSRAARRRRKVRRTTSRTFDHGALAKEIVVDFDDPDVTPETPMVGMAKAIEATPGADVACIVLKAEAARRFTLGLAYPANKVDVAKAKDGHRDFVGPEALEACAWRYMTKSRELGLFHADGTEGHGTVVESYIYRGPDWTADDGTVIKAGDWLLGTIWDEETWPLVLTGQLGGYSPTGRAARKPASAETVASLRSA